MATRFVHTLLFSCPECNLPVAISRVSEEKNFEGVDGENLRIRCSYCENVSDTTAVMAKKHYVEEWPNQFGGRAARVGEEEPHFRLLEKSGDAGSMSIPSFHDGHFDGLLIGPNRLVNLFLRTQDGISFSVILEEMDALTLSEIKEGNIILDVVFRSTAELTYSDMAELYSVDVNAPQASELLRAKREQGFQLLEINASYGARGLVLFQAFQIRQVNSKSTA